MEWETFSIATSRIQLAHSFLVAIPPLDSSAFHSVKFGHSTSLQARVKSVMKCHSAGIVTYFLSVYELRRMDLNIQE